MAEFLTVKEAARRKGCHLKFIYDLLGAGKLPGAEKAGKVWRIPASAVPVAATAKHQEADHAEK